MYIIELNNESSIALKDRQVIKFFTNSVTHIYQIMEICPVDNMITLRYWEQYGDNLMCRETHTTSVEHFKKRIIDTLYMADYEDMEIIDITDVETVY